MSSSTTESDMHPTFASPPYNLSLQNLRFYENMIVCTSGRSSSCHQISMAGEPQSPPKPLEYLQFRTDTHSSFCESGSLSAGEHPPTTPRLSPLHSTACTNVSDRYPERNEQRVVKYEEYLYPEISRSSSDISLSQESKFEFTGSFSSDVMLVDRYDQLNRCIDPSTTQTFSSGEVKGGSVGNSNGPQVIANETFSGRRAPADLNRPHTESSRTGQNRAFLMLRGYRGKRNTKLLFDCFEDCRKGRLGCRGFERRSNLLTHLRSCHGQNIPKFDRENSQKIKAVRSRARVADSNE